MQLRAAIWCLLAAMGCTPAAVRPIPSIAYLSKEKPARTTVLLLPGRYSRAEDFERNGFVSAIRQRGLDVELVAVDAHLGYYVDERYRTFPDTLHEDVVLPRLRRGSRRFWLVGTSLGALGCIAYAKKHPDAVAGLLLLGAYLGEPGIIADVERAGGIVPWQPKPNAGYDYERRTWEWLKGYAAHQPRPTLYTAYGTEDRFAAANAMVAAVLPATHVLVAEAGEHDFETWARLWTRFLDCCGQALVGS